MTGCFSLITPRKNGRKPASSISNSVSKGNTPASLSCACCSFEPLPEYSSHQKGRFSSRPAELEKLEGIMADVAKTIEGRIESLDQDLRHLSLQMWSFKEIQWQEQ
jgi:hypothetical protein